MSFFKLKTSISGLMALLLVCYSAAWAVLRCPHEGNFAQMPVALSDMSNRSADLSYFLLLEDRAYLDCLGANYHLEPLAVFSASTELRLSMIDAFTHAGPFLKMRYIERQATEDLWRPALFARESARIFAGESARYLSLSVLRI